MKSSLTIQQQKSEATKLKDRHKHMKLVQTQKVKMQEPSSSSAGQKKSPPLQLRSRSRSRRRPSQPPSERMRRQGSSAPLQRPQPVQQSLPSTSSHGQQKVKGKGKKGVWWVKKSRQKANKKGVSISSMVDVGRHLPIELVQKQTKWCP